MERRKIGLVGPEVARRAIDAADGDWVSMPVAGSVDANTGEIRWNPGFEWLGKTGTPINDLAWDGMMAK